MPDGTRLARFGRYAIRARDAAEGFRQSLFFLPAIFVIAAALLAWSLSVVQTGGDPESWPRFLQSTLSSERDVLTTVATGVMAAVSIVFAVMLVALQLSASRFSPRVIREFIGDRLIQIVMGVEIGTVAYALLALQFAGTGGDEQIVGVSAIAGVVLAIIALLGLLAAVDHLAQSLQVGSIARRVTGETLSLIRKSVAGELEPETLMFQTSRMVPAVGVDAADGTPIMAWQEGWIQQIGHQALTDAIPEGHRLILDVAIGSYVGEGTPIGGLVPAVDDPEPVERQLRDAIDIGKERTMQQDIGYGIVRLQDIALLALSPSINDLNTGIEAIVRLGSILTALLVCEPGPPEEHTIRPANVPEFDDFVSAAFDEIRISAAPHPSVLQSLLRTLGRVKDEAVRGGHDHALDAIDEQGRLVVAGLDSGAIFLEADRNRVVEVAHKALGI